MIDEATPLMLTIPEEDKDENFERVHRNRSGQPTTSSAAAGDEGSIFALFGSALLNFRMIKNNNTNDGNNNYGHQNINNYSHKHRRSAGDGSIFNFGSTLIHELRHEFIDYENMEGGSVALDALFSIAQTTADALEDDLQHDNIIQHPTLVDPNDLAMATVLIVEEELDYGDLRWSLLSNTFFIFGGFYECINVIWGLNTKNDGQQEEEDTSTNKFRIGISLLGPLVYCFNSIVDITWALRVEQRQDRRQQLDELKIDLIAPDEDVEVVEERQEHEEKKEGGNQQHQQQQHQQTKKMIRLRLPFEPHNIWRRLRRHIGHRRAISAAIAFGIGAFLEFTKSYQEEFSTAVSDDNEGRLHVVDALSVNAYAASAIFALFAKEGDDRTVKPWKDVWYDSPRLERIGDIFFGVATTVDCCICYLHLDKYGSFIYYIWPLISASLWLFDALCYLRADVNSMKRYKKSRPLGPASEENDSSTCSSSCDFQEQQQQ